MKKKNNALSKALEGDARALLAVSRKGISPALLRGYASKSPYTYTEIVTMLGVTKNSLKEVKKGYRRYNQDTSSRILLFMMLLNKLMKKDANPDAVHQWMDTTDKLFRIPRKKMLDTPLSIKYLIDLADRK